MPDSNLILLKSQAKDLLRQANLLDDKSCRLVDEYESEIPLQLFVSSIEILKTAGFLNHTYFQLYSELRGCYKHYFNVHCSVLHSENLLDEITLKALLTNRALITNTDSPLLADVFKQFKALDLLNEENRGIVLRSSGVVNLSKAIRALKKSALLTKKILDVLIKNKEIEAAVNLLSDSDQLTPENLDAIITHRRPEALAYTLSKLAKLHLLTPATRKKAIEYKGVNRIFYAARHMVRERYQSLYEADYYVGDTEMVAHILQTLRVMGLGTEENYRRALECDDLSNLEYALTILDYAKAKTQSHFDKIIAYKDPKRLAFAIWKLHKGGLLENPDNYQFLDHPPDPGSFCHVIQILSDAAIFNDNNLLRVRQLNDDALRLLENNMCGLTEIDITPTQLHLDSFFKLNAKGAKFSCPIVDIGKALSLFIKEVEEQRGEDSPSYRQALRLSSVMNPIYQKNNNCMEEADGQLFKKKLAQLTIKNAEKIFGTDHKLFRILADVLMIALSITGIGLGLMATKKHFTGNTFFYFGYEKKRELVNALSDQFISNEVTCRH